MKSLAFLFGLIFLTGTAFALPNTYNPTYDTTIGRTSFTFLGNVNLNGWGLYGLGFLNMNAKNITNIDYLCFKDGNCTNSITAGNSSNSTNGTLTSITQGWGISLTPNPITSTGIITANQTELDARYSVNLGGYQLEGVTPCTAGNAVVGLGDTLSCSPFLTSFTEIDPLWSGNASRVTALENANETSNSRIDALNTSKLDSSDQRYNDSVRISTLNTSKLDKNTAISGATKTKITYDANGLITSGADATTADIADSTDKRYVTDAMKNDMIANTTNKSVYWDGYSTHPTIWDLWNTDRPNYINTTKAWTNDTNIGLSGTTLTWLGTLADGRIASATTWNGKAGTGTATCGSGTVAQNVTTSTGGVTSQCLNFPASSGGNVTSTAFSVAGTTTTIRINNSDGSYVTGAFNDQTSAGASARFVTAGDTSSKNYVSMPDKVIIYEQFYNILTTYMTKLGTETSDTIDVDALGVHKYATSATIGSDALVSVGGVTTTNTKNYNITKMTMFAAGINITNTTNVGQAIMIGAIATPKNQELWNMSLANTSGVFFYYNGTGTNNGNWTAYVCNGNNTACTSNNTLRFPPIYPATRYDDYRIMSDGAGTYTAFYINNTLVSNLTTTSTFPYQNRTAIIGVWEEAKAVAVAQAFKINYLYYEANRR